MGAPLAGGLLPDTGCLRRGVPVLLRQRWIHWCGTSQRCSGFGGAVPSPSSSSGPSITCIHFSSLSFSLFPFQRLFVISLERLCICVLRMPICVCVSVCVSVCWRWEELYARAVNEECFSLQKWIRWVSVFLASPCRHRCCRLIEFNEIPSVKVESKAWSYSRNILSQMLHLLLWLWAPHCLLCRRNHFK